MWPPEIVPPVLQAVGRATPHAWAVDALVEVVGRGGGIRDIAAELGILTAFALALLALATWRLSRTLTR